MYKRIDDRTQSFNGKTYYLYDNSNYFSKANKRLHRVVWEFYNGEIKEGYDIHHVNGDTTDNRIENLNLVRRELHQRFTGKQRFKNNPEWAKSFYSKGIEKAKDWHKSEEGLKWHKEHARNFKFGTFDIEEKKCLLCSEIFKPKAHHSKFCSNKCKSKYRRVKGLDDVKKNCVFCNKEFTSNKYQKRTHCSKSCSSRNRGKGSI